MWFPVPAGFKLVNLQAQRQREMTQINFLKLFLMLEERCVHFPELPLLGGRFRRLRCRAGVRMDRALRKMPKHESQTLPHALPHFFDDRNGIQTGRAFIIPIFHNR